MGNSLFSFNEALNIRGAVVISCQSSSDILKVKHELRKVMNSNSYIEVGIKQGSVSAPFNPQILSERFCHIRHDLHQTFGALFRYRPVIELTLGGDKGQDEFGVMIVTGRLFVDDLSEL